MNNMIQEILERYNCTTKEEYFSDKTKNISFKRC